MKQLQVGRQTAAFLKRGHPWVRKDRFVKGLEQLKAGEAVTLVDERKQALASALADPERSICARVYHRRPNKPFSAAAAWERAYQQRAALHDDPATTCYRLVHGEADFLPGLRIERLGQVIVMQVRASCMLPHVPTLGKAISTTLPDAQVIIREHLDDIRRQQSSCRALDGEPLDPQAVVLAKELGCTYRLQPYADLATGIYVDQRGTREWLLPRCAGKRVLNCFAYTGVFSTALLHAGAASACDLDLSSVCLAIADANAAHNGFSDRHRSITADCRAWMQGCQEEFDLIIVDPPTSAQGGGKRGWLLRRDYPELLQQAWRCLAPEGLLIACCNTLGKKDLDMKSLLAALPDAESIDKLPALGGDIPQLKGFPEGRPYQLAVAQKPRLPQ